MELQRRTILKVGVVLGFGTLAKTLDFLPAHANNPEKRFEITKTDEEWRSILTPEQYQVLRQEATEPPFRNKYHAHEAQGTYHCAGCELPVFSSETKYDSQTGWRAFGNPSRR